MKIAIEEISKLKNQIDTLRLQQARDDFDREARLTPDEKGYAVASSDIGSILFSIKTIRSKANGSSVTLEVGNTSSVSIPELGAHARWGQADKSGEEVPDSGSEKDVTFESLSPGRWATRTIDLPATPPSELGFIVLNRVSSRRVSLTQ